MVINHKTYDDYILPLSYASKYYLLRNEVENNLSLYFAYGFSLSISLSTGGLTAVYLFLLFKDIACSIFQIVSQYSCYLKYRYQSTQCQHLYNRCISNSSIYFPHLLV